ncbi:MAG: prolyl oligopeptidase family serine peptidase [Pseudomonadota bacterium]
MKRLPDIRLLLPTVLLSMTTACGSSSPSAPAAENDSAEKATTSSGCVTGASPKSWIAGTTELCAGHLIYHDYLYDDHGADDGPGLPHNPYSAATLSQSAGAASYPAGAENTADLVRFDMALSGDMVDVTFELNTLYSADQTIAAVAIDTDHNIATGGGTLPGLGVSAPGWDVLQTFRSGDPATNLIHGRFRKPAGRVWTVFALLAQADGTVMNVAFRGVNEQAAAQPSKTALTTLLTSGAFFEDLQAAALRQKDISPFSATVAVADLERGVTRPAPAVTEGLHERVYTSAWTVPRSTDETTGEGVAPAGVPGRGTGGSVPALAQNFVFLGRYQPYAIYLPKPGNSSTTRQPSPLQMVFHGTGAVMSSQINQANFQQAFGDDLGRILVSPMNRGPSGYGSDYSERDILDVMADVQRNYAIDPERIIASGYSQGGYIAFRMSMLYPQVFAGFVEWVGVTGNRLRGNPVGTVIEVNAGAVGDMHDYIPNLRHVPGAMVHGALDELAPVLATRATADAFLASDNIFEWFLHPTAEHLSFLLLDDWRKEALYSKDFKRVINPARITYRTDPELGNAALGIRHDRAYWASAITTRDSGAGVLDLTNHGCGGEMPAGIVGRRQGIDPVLWISDNRTTAAPKALAAEALLEGSLANLKSLSIDAAQTCLAGKPVHYRLSSDGPVTLRLSDGRSVTLAAGNSEGTL